MELTPHTNKTASKSWDWFSERAHGAHAKFWLAFLAFSESSFLIISPDLLLVAILMAGATRWVYFASLTTIASVAGGIFGYFIAAFFYDLLGSRVVEFYGFAEEMAQVGALFDENTFWVIFLAAFTFIPYKIFVLAGGFFKINFLLFLVASTLGRGLRFFIVAYVVKVYGERMIRILLRHFVKVTAIVLFIVLVYLLIRYDIVAVLLG